jgi:hypothetical protein
MRRGSYSIMAGAQVVSLVPRPRYFPAIAKACTFSDRLTSLNFLSNSESSISGQLGLKGVRHHRPPPGLEEWCIRGAAREMASFILDKPTLDSIDILKARLEAAKGPASRGVNAASVSGFLRFQATLSATSAVVDLRTVVSVSNFFQADHYACWFGPVLSQRCEIPVIPTSNSYYLPVLSRRARNLKQLQYVESLAVEKKRVLPK